MPASETGRVILTESQSGNAARAASILRLVATLMALAIATLAIPSAAAAAPGPRSPGLYLEGVENPNYVVRPDDVTVAYKLRLVGGKSASDVSVRITFTRSGARRPSRGETKQFGLFPPSPPNPLEDEVVVDLQMGRYEVEACVRMRYRGRKVVRCKQGKDLSVIPMSWHGSATVTAPLHHQAGTGAIQGSTADAGTGFAGFFFEGPSGREFSYSASGSVTFFVDGTDPEGCEWSGSKTVSVSAGDKLMLSKNLLGYRFVPQTSFAPYPATADCPPPYEDTNATLYSGPWLPAFPQSRARSTETTLSGTVPVIPGLPGAYTWSLLAAG